MKKLIIIITFILLLTGCTSYTELNDLSIVNTIAIDYQDNNYNLILNTITGYIENDAVDKNITTYKSFKPSLEEAFHDIYLTSSKRLYLSHIDLLILTEDSVNNKLLEIINSFLNNNETRNNFNIVILKDIDLNSFMDKKIESKDIINLLSINNQETGITIKKDFEELMKDLLIDNNSYLPTVTFDNELILKGYSLIKNYKYYEEMSINDSIIFNLLNNKINKAYIDNNSILNNQTIIKTNNNIINFNFITTLNRDNNFKENIIDDIDNFLIKYQNKNYDILKLTELVRKNNYSYYKNTNDLLAKLKFMYKFNLKIETKDVEGELDNGK